MAEDELDRLAELRDKGVLSEAEFQNARVRLLRQRRAEAPPPKPSILQAYWPAFVGLGILLVLIIGVVVFGQMAAQEDQIDLNISVSSDAGANVLDTAPNGVELCSAGSAFVQIKDMIFERAQKQYGGDPGPLESLRGAAVVRVQYPMMRSLRQELGRTECNGHFILDLPPSVRSAFDGMAALEADIDYSVQAASNGTGTVTDVTGADQVIDQLAVAASLVGGPGKVPVPAGTNGPTVAQPSFDCLGTLSNVERMICQNDQLAKLDRSLAELYLALRRELPGPEWQLVNESQRDFLRRRAGCTTIACLNDVYVAQTRFLQRFGPG